MDKLSSKRKCLRRLSELFALLTFITLGLYGWHTAKFGLDLTDEGFYLATANRYVLGDSPWRDEVQTAWVMFDILLWPILELFPDATVLQMRRLGMFLQLASLGALYWFARHRIPAFLAAAACASVAFIRPSLWTPSYNTISHSFYIISMVTWLHWAVSPKRSVRLTSAAVAGFLFFLSTVAYLPLGATLLMPAALGAVLTVKKRRSRIRLLDSIWVFVALPIGLWVLSFAIFSNQNCRHSS